jgi:hypothetical protein
LFDLWQSNDEALRLSDTIINDAANTYNIDSVSYDEIRNNNEADLVENVNEMID